MSATSSRPVLNEMYAGFVQGGVSIVAATRDARNVPTAARMVGCRMSPDRTRVSVFAPTARVAAMIELLQNGAPIAVVFSQPSTHQSIQLKAQRVDVRPIDERELELIQRYTNAFVAEVLPFGFSDPFTRALLAFDSGEVVAFEFTPDAAFLQTPGARAGCALTC